MYTGNFFRQVCDFLNKPDAVTGKVENFWCDISMLKKMEPPI